MSFKPLFSKSLAAQGDRLHFAAHSHHLWPDASYAGQSQCWEDAAALADLKWGKVMGEVWPKAAAGVAEELGLGADDGRRIVFASNTHDFLIRLVAACPRRDPSRLRVLTTDGEFHSARRQFARWSEDGWLDVEQIATQPFDDFAERFVAAAKSGGHDLIFVSQVMFGTGRIFDRIAELAALSRPDGPWVVVDGYHAFMALEAPLDPAVADRIFFLGGGYKYAMSGEGMAFLHCPDGFGMRPPLTGWFAEFGELESPPGGVGYTRDAMRFMGATFDPSALYRWNAIRSDFVEAGITTGVVNDYVGTLQRRAVDLLGATTVGRAELLNPLDGHPHARFLAYRSPQAPEWQRQLLELGVVTDVRGDVMRIGFGIYQDEEDVARLGRAAAALG